MKRFVIACAAVLVASFAGASSASAQGNFVWLGGSATVPIGDSGDALKTGYLLDFGFGRPINEKLGLQIGGLYGSSDAKTGTGSIDLLGGSVGLGYNFTTEAMLNPYVLGSVGMMQSDNGVTDAESEFMFQIGAGLFKTLSTRFGFWAEARYLSAGSGNTKLTLVPVAAGISITLGGN